MYSELELSLDKQLHDTCRRTPFSELYCMQRARAHCCLCWRNPKVVSHSAHFCSEDGRQDIFARRKKTFIVSS